MMSQALNRYIARTYITHFLMLLVILLGVVYLFDLVELMRRASEKQDISLSLIAKMGFFKLPEVGQIILPFVILFSAMFTLWQLNRRQEIVVARAAGVSVWQFIRPILLTAFAVGVVHVTIINPIGAALISRFDTLESQYLGAQKNLVSLTKEGLWLRQSLPEGQDGNIILHARQIKLPEWQLRNVMALFFAPDDRLIKRIDAPQGQLEKGEFVLDNTRQYTEGKRGYKSFSSYKIATNLSRAEIEESFADPETVSFWVLPGFIQTLEETGFDSTRIKIYFYSLIVQPLFYLAMIILAASVCMRPPRSTRPVRLILLGVVIGFALFFLESFLQALGASHQIPLILAVVAPSLIALMAGTGALVMLEDG